MRRRHSLQVALAAVLGALAILALPALASAKDRNHDRIPDRWEKRHHLSLKVNQANRDQDNDSLDNRGEFRAGDNPRDDDSDGDGVMDGNENAGTITAFDPASGKLTVAVFNGDSISGLVTSATEIKCEGPDDHSASSSRDHGSSGSGDDNGGRGEEEPGDDHGEGVEPGDDHGGRGEQEPGDDHGDNSGPGSSNSGPGRGDDNDDNGVQCTTADLTVGTVVHEADLELQNGVATFDEVELAHTS